jgi:hypothetical protein
MNRIDKVKATAEKHGATLGEYLAMHIATAFAMGDDEAASIIAKAIAGSPHANLDGHAAIQNCFAKEWMERTPAGMLALTRSGQMVAHKIGGDLTEP